MTIGRLQRDENDEMARGGILSCYVYQLEFSVSLSQSPMSGRGSLASKCLIWLLSREDNSHLLYWNRGIGPSSSRSRITITSMSTCQQCNFFMCSMISSPNLAPYHILAHAMTHGAMIALESFMGG